MGTAQDEAAATFAAATAATFAAATFAATSGTSQRDGTAAACQLKGERARAVFLSHIT